MNGMESSQTMSRRTIDIGQVLTDAGRTFVEDIVPLILATLIAGALTVVTLGILAGPMFAGLVGMLIARTRDGKKPEVGDVFAGLHRFWSYFGAALVLGLLIGLASITIIGGILLAAIWLYVFPLMVERGMGIGEAMGASKDMVMRGGFWEHVVLVLLIAVLSALGNGLFALLTIPFTVALVVTAYGQRRQSESAGVPA